MRRAVLVIGATGILAPAVDALRNAGRNVVAVSRGTRPEPEGVETVHVDAEDGVALSDALAGRAWVDALVYAPAVSDSSLEWLRAATRGRLVLVRTSAAADPRRGDLAVPPGTLQLGWRDADADSASTGPEVTGAATAAGSGVPARHPPPTERWHTPAEVSAAALAVLADGTARTLGSVRPWSDRP